MPEIRERFSLGESHAAGVRDLTRFILIPGFATALDLFPVPILVLTACGALEIKVRAAPVLAQKALTHGVLTRTDVVKERGGSIADRPPPNASSLQRRSDRRRLGRR